MLYKENDFLTVIKNSFNKYKLHGARSPEKLKPIHRYIGEILKDIWGQKYFIHYMADNNKEFTVKGKYYQKDIDITVTFNSKPVFCLGVKFVTSNYKQNSNNYFENMMGETANIQALGNIPYAQLIILRYKTPYYEKNEVNIPKKIEIINEHDLSKYLKLFYDNPQAHRPNILGIIIVDINENDMSVTSTNINQYFKKEFCLLLNDKLSLPNFFKEIENFKLYFETQNG